MYQHGQLCVRGAVDDQAGSRQVLLRELAHVPVPQDGTRVAALPVDGFLERQREYRQPAAALFHVARERAERSVRALARAVYDERMSLSSGHGSRYEGALWQLSKE